MQAKIRQVKAAQQNAIHNDQFDQAIYASQAAEFYQNIDTNLKDLKKHQQRFKSQGMHNKAAILENA